MADEDLNDLGNDQIDGIVPPGGGFVDEEDQNRSEREDQQGSNDWRRAAKEVKNRTGNKSKSGQQDPQAQGQKGQAPNAASKQGQTTASQGAAKQGAATGASGSAASSGASKAAGGAAAGSASKAASAGKAGGKANPAADIAEDAEKLKQARSISDVREQAGNIVGDVVVADATGGLVSAKLGTIQRDPSLKSVGENVSVVGIKAKTWMALIALLFVVNTLMLMLVITLSMAAACEALSFRVFAIDIGLKTSGVLTGVDLESICGAVTKLTSGIKGGSGGGGGGGGGAPPGEACSPLPSGPASLDNLSRSCFGANAAEASGIARQESGGNPAIASGVDKCEPGGESVSWGLFQINISVHRLGNLNCPAAFDNPYTARNHQCKVINRTLYDQCVAAAKDPAQNIAAACRISNNGNNWNPWGANRICKF